ncbi:MAG: glycosylhydrolase-like jelly roll fold domain-containing protein, partial [Mucilaginibacter sp.]
MRGPETPVTFDKLIDWSTSADERIKSYSGTAVYRTTFNAADYKGEAVYLNLGKVAVMAKVKLNGKDMGPVWTAPYRVNITSALKKGANVLEIEVVNTWINRLIGDAKLPVADRKTWINFNPYNADSGYQAAGLIGPVILQRLK